MAIPCCIEPLVPSCSGQSYRKGTAQCFHQKTLQAKRKHIRETVQVLQQTNKTLDELPLNAETAEKCYNSMDSDSTGLPRINGLPSSLYAANNDFSPSYMASPTKPRHRKSTHSGEQPSPYHSRADSNGSGYYSRLGSYPIIDS